eukprot:scaffold7831_cov95-Phaeocystis_antarctica.AAC.5
MEACAEVAKPEWWNDEGLKALSARVVRAAPNDVGATQMRAVVLSGQCGGSWGEAAKHFDRAAALCSAPEGKAAFAESAIFCHDQAEAMFHPDYIPPSYVLEYS